MLDLFAGAGGLSSGLRQAGFKPVAAIELMADAAKTYREAHGVPVLEERVGEADLEAFHGEVEVVVGGPPCQPWSTGGLRLGEEDERDGLPEFFNALRIIQPRAFLIENVAGLGQGSTREYLVTLLEALKELGYQVESEVLNAADYGVPQHRYRRVIVGLREGQFKFPPSTHGPERRNQWVPASSVLTAEPANEENLSIVTYAKNPHLRPSPYDGLLFNGGGRPINLSAPARTVLASAGGNKTPFIDTQKVVPSYHESLWNHYKTHGCKGLAKKVRSGVVPGARRITVAESAALQSFDEATKFYGTRSTQYTLVGNAVPPKLARAVGLRFAASLRATPAR
jgi:DNA (cytosine-5)-methyltransferase 1